MNPVPDQGPIAGDVEIRAQAMQGLLNSFMACGESQLERLVAQVVVVGEEHVTAVKEEAVVEMPGHLELTGTRARAVAWRTTSRKAKFGLERTHMAPSSAAASWACSASRRERASATVLSRPGRYSTVKSKPNSLLIH
jgi:hypothetical protein